MRTILFIVCVASACADDPTPPECTQPTTYLSPERDCMAGDGVCVAKDGVVACLPKCSTTGSACSVDGTWWFTLTTDVAEVCYCDVAPGTSR